MLSAFAFAFALVWFGLQDWRDGFLSPRCLEHSMHCGTFLRFVSQLNHSLRCDNRVGSMR